MEQKLNRYIRTYPFFAGITGDFLFLPAIETLFMTVVKNLTSAEIVSLTSISTFSCILLQFPILKLIKKLGNTRSTQISAFMLLIGALSITFGNGFFLMAFGKTCRQLSVLFRSTLSVSLKNNLDLLHRENDYVKFRTAGNMSYSIITMLISFVASSMFVWNNMSPMYACIVCAAVGVLLSSVMIDHSDYDKIIQNKEKKRTKQRMEKLILLALISFSIFYPLVELGQSNGMLFLQQNLLETLDVNKTALLIGAVTAISRIVRVFSNMMFVRIYRKLKSKVGVLLPFLLAASFALLIIGSLLSSVLLVTATMGVGYLVLLFIRDPIKIYIQDVILTNTKKEAHQSLIATMELSAMTGTAVISVSFSMLLLKFPMSAVISTMLVLSFAEIILASRLFLLLRSAKKVVV